MTTGRYQDAVSVLNQDVFSSLKNKRILMVGAGGIGCELLKNLVMVGGWDHLDVVCCMACLF
jgi:molybdopterin/thiamine biosynthesis adenylyltransferase